MTRSTISPSSISLSLLSLLLLFLSVSLFCATFACATSLNKIEHCELDCATSATVDGLNVVGNCEPKCSEGFKVPKDIEKQGQDATKRYLDNIFSNAFFGSDSTETGQNKEAYPHSYAIDIKDEGERNVDAEKSAYEQNEKHGEEHRMTIPSDVENQGQDAIKKYLGNIFSNALFGSDSTETGQNREVHPHSNSIELDNKTQIKNEGERNMNSYKSSYKLPKKQGEEQLLDSDIAVNVDLEIKGDGEYVLKIKKMNPSSTNEDEVERAKRMAQNGAMLLLYGEMLQDMGEKMIAQSQALVYSVFKMPAPPKSKKSDR